MVNLGLNLKPAFYRIILKFPIGEVEARKLAELTGLTISSVRKYLSVLVKEGLVSRTNTDKYVLTEKGLNFRRFLEKMDPSYRSEAPYVFTDPNTGSPVPVQIRNYTQLYAVLRYDLIDKSIVEEHVKRGYLLEWIKSAMNDQHLAEKISKGEINSIDELLEYLEFHYKVVEGRRRVGNK